MSHGDKVVELPAGFEVTAITQAVPIAAMANESKTHYYGLQFHPEVTHMQGEALISRFVHQICGCTNAWTPNNIIENACGAIKTTNWR